MLRRKFSCWVLSHMRDRSDTGGAEQRLRQRDGAVGVLAKFAGYSERTSVTPRPNRQSLYRHRLDSRSNRRDPRQQPGGSCHRKHRQPYRPDAPEPLAERQARRSNVPLCSVFRSITATLFAGGTATISQRPSFVAAVPYPKPGSCTQALNFVGGRVDDRELRLGLVGREDHAVIG